MWVFITTRHPWMKIWLTNLNVQFYGVRIGYHLQGTGQEYTHTHSIPALVVKEVKQVFHDLTSTNLLKQCLLGKIQYPNEFLTGLFRYLKTLNILAFSYSILMPVTQYYYLMMAVPQQFNFKTDQELRVSAKVWCWPRFQDVKNFMRKSEVTVTKKKYTV